MAATNPHKPVDAQNTTNGASATSVELQPPVAPSDQTGISISSTPQTTTQPVATPTSHKIPAAIDVKERAEKWTMLESPDVPIFEAPAKLDLSDWEKIPTSFIFTPAVATSHSVIKKVIIQDYIYRKGRLIWSNTMGSKIITIECIDEQSAKTLKDRISLKEHVKCTGNKVFLSTRETLSSVSRVGRTVRKEQINSEETLNLYQFLDAQGITSNIEVRRELLKWLQPFEYIRQFANQEKEVDEVWVFVKEMDYESFYKVYLETVVKNNALIKFERIVDCYHRLLNLNIDSATVDVDILKIDWHNEIFNACIKLAKAHGFNSGGLDEKENLEGFAIWINELRQRIEALKSSVPAQKFSEYLVADDKGFSDKYLPYAKYFSYQYTLAKLHEGQGDFENAVETYKLLTSLLVPAKTSDLYQECSQKATMLPILQAQVIFDNPNSTSAAKQKAQEYLEESFTSSMKLQNDFHGYMMRYTTYYYLTHGHALPTVLSERAIPRITQDRLHFQVMADMKSLNMKVDELTEQMLKMKTAYTELQTQNAELRTEVSVLLKEKREKQVAAASEDAKPMMPVNSMPTHLTDLGTPIVRPLVLHQYGSAAPTVGPSATAPPAAANVALSATVAIHSPEVDEVNTGGAIKAPLS